VALKEKYKTALMPDELISLFLSFEGKDVRMRESNLYKVG
jgi:hypothetical protein